MFKIRLLEKEDAAKYFILRLEGLSLFPTAYGGTYQEELLRGASHYVEILARDRSRNAILGAFEDDDLIGCIGIFQEHGLNFSHKAKIWGMYVRTAYQGKGIGKELLQNAVKHIGQQPEVELINLTVESNNMGAKALYEKCGFSVWGTETRALKINGVHYDEDKMMLLLK